MITLLLYLCVICNAIVLIRADSIADPWPEAQHLLNTIAKSRDPMKEAAMEPNADEFVGFYVPMDYSPRNEEKTTRAFGKTKSQILNVIFMNYLYNQVNNSTTQKQHIHLARFTFGVNIISRII